ncbi:hypothetical protein H0R92_04480 [Treponema sp. OMZ 840]|uniref:shikimate kinase n=1 Tax=Treponema sp. OMZ 840 TaxID=244313 RepID=UPI003D90854C
MKCIILTGIQHSGKTTAGKLLAGQTGGVFFDTDKLIEQKTGLSCRELYAQKGVEFFKKTELDACFFLEEYAKYAENKQLTPQSGKTNKTLGAIISTGGGICDNPRALSVLETIGCLAYLHVSEATAFERICARAKLTGSFPAYIEKLSPENDAHRRSIFHGIYEKRTAEYKKRAKLHIDTEGLSPEDVCAALFSAIQTFE